MAVTLVSSILHTVPRHSPDRDHRHTRLSSLHVYSSPKGVQHTADTTSLSAKVVSGEWALWEGRGLFGQGVAILLGVPTANAP